MGTMGGDLESNDEDCEEEEEECTSASQGSWVASLPSLSSRRRMTDVRSSLGGVGIGAAVGENDDAATCAEMTTAAVAPRRKAHRRKKNESPLFNGERKRRAIGFAFESQMDELLEVEEIELDPMFDRKPAAVAAAASSQHPKNDVIDNTTNASSHSLPPVECIPDPLLVAAQHAAVGGNTNELSQNHENVNGTGLFVGDCYSSVTEEETSLAEDEASLSAVSLGGNTTTSVGGTTMTSSKEGVRSAEFGNRGAASAQDVELKPAPPPAFARHNVNNAMQQYEKASDYNLNSLLGNLHRERQQRQSSPHRRGSSYHSMGSTGMHSNVSGNSHQSCPMNFAGQMLQDVDMDVDMEGPTGSISSAHGSQTNSQSGSDSRDSVPKWKRRVKLPSHSSLY